MEHKALLQESCEKMGVSLTEEMASQFMTYLSLLLEWNEKMNLTAITDKKDVVCLLYTSPSPRDRQKSRMPSSA